MSVTFVQLGVWLSSIVVHIKKLTSPTAPVPDTPVGIIVSSTEIATVPTAPVPATPDITGTTVAPSAPIAPVPLTPFTATFVL